jgi:hypothetical protein
MYLDTNGDGVHTDADTIDPVGTTTVDVWLRTDADRDGTPRSCATPGRLLTVSSLEFTLHATDGTIGWGDCTIVEGLDYTCNSQQSDSTDFYTSFNNVSSPPPGLYRLATLSLSVTSGTPSVHIATSSSRLQHASTAFGSPCPDSQRGNTWTLGLDWFDTDGARYGGWPNAPTLAQPGSMTVAEGAIAEQQITAADPDGSTVTFSKESGPSYLTVETLGSTPGAATGQIELAPGYFDTGKAIGEVRASDGVGSDFRSFWFQVLNTNRAPQLDSIADICIEQGQSRQVYVQATDPDGGSVTFNGTGLPPSVQLTNLGYNYASLEINPSLSEAIGATPFTIFVSDGAASDSQIVQFRVGALGDCSGRGPIQAVVFPNPMTTSATLSFWTSRGGHLRVTLYDIRGRLVRTLFDMSGAPAANYQVLIDAGNSGEAYGGASGYLASGLYFYRIESGDGVSRGRVLVLRGRYDLDGY